MLLEDIDEFENRIDTYLNADIYLCKWSGEEILQNLGDLRYKRGRETYHCLINIMLRCLKRLTNSLTKNKWYEGDEVLSELVTRPWGEEGADTKCFQFTARVLLDGAHGKRSLLSLVTGRMPQLSGNDIDGYILVRDDIHEGFMGRKINEKNHLDIEIPLILEALQGFVGPYGQCSAVEPMQTECRCLNPHESVEDEKAKHLVQEAAVIQKVVVTDEEAKRKKREEYDIKVFGMLIEKKTEDTLKGKVGLKTIRTKMKQLKEETKDQLIDTKDDLKLAQNKSNKANVDLENMRKRKHIYGENPSAVDQHGFTSLRQAEQAVAKLEKVQLENLTALELVENKESFLKKRKKLSAKKWREEAKKTILDEKREEEKRRIIKDNRIEAMKMGLRRPWDGENGEDFIRWVAARKGGEEGVVSAGEETESSTDDDIAGEGGSDGDSDGSSDSSDDSIDDETLLLMDDVGEGSDGDNDSGSSASGSDDGSSISSGSEVGGSDMSSEVTEETS